VQFLFENKKYWFFSIKYIILSYKSKEKDNIKIVCILYFVNGKFLKNNIYYCIGSNCHTNRTLVVVKVTTICFANATIFRSSASNLLHLSKDEYIVYIINYNIHLSCLLYKYTSFFDDTVVQLLLLLYETITKHFKAPPRTYH